MFPLKVREGLQAGMLDVLELGKLLLAIDGEIDRLHKLQVEHTDLLARLQLALSEVQTKFVQRPKA